MATVHIIDEVVFDFSYDSIAIAREHESDINTWLTEQLLPVVDSILNAFDDAQTVLRLDRIELDLGDISNDDFYSEIIRKVSEQLADQLRDAGKSHSSEPLSTVNTSSAAPQSIRQISQSQVDVERLKDFLLTGNMAWHIDTLERNVHERMLAHVLQQTGNTFIQFLQQSQSTTRRVLIKRLVKQFPSQHLARLLAELTPASASLILDLMTVIQSVFAQAQSAVVKPEELTNWMWMLTFETLLEEVQASDGQAAVIQKILQQFEMLQTRAPDLVARKVLQVAENLAHEQKINAELPKILLELTSAEGKQLITKDVTNQIVPTPEVLISSDTQVINNPLSPAVISSKHSEQDQATTNTAIYQRIVQAIFKASIAGIDAKALVHVDAEEIRQQLLSFIQQAEIRGQLAEKLPKRVLLDIIYLLSPQAAALIEQLLAQSTILLQATDATKQSSEAAWQQQLWTGSLTVLVTVQETSFDPADYLQALARWFSTTQEASVVVQAWYTALEQSQNYGTLHNILQQLVIESDNKLVTETSGSPAYQQLVQRLTTQPDEVITSDLHTIIARLATDNPEELRHIFQALRRGEYSLISAELKSAELRSLIAALIKTQAQVQAPNIGGVQQDFVHAIERHAAQAKDQGIYYQQVLEALLQGDVVDLEAFALQMRHAPTLIPTPTLAPTISDNTHKTSVPITNLLTINTAIYQRIVQAIVKANITGVDAKALTHAEPGEREIRQQLLSIGKNAEMRVRLAEKLPERVLLDIAYLLSPQAAALIEQLLAQSTILLQATDATKQSSEATWQQQLWIGSLTVLMTAQETTFDAADYLQALARWFSITQEASVVVQAWYTALEQSQSYGSLHNILQQLIAQLDNRLPKAIAKLETPTETSGSPAYQQLYKRLTAQTDEALSTDLQTVIDRLVTDNPEELRRIFQAFRHGELFLASAKLKVTELRSLVAALIKTQTQVQAPNVGEAQQNFIQAIESHAAQAIDQVVYYQQILEALLQGEVVDLEAFALQRALKTKQPVGIQQPVAKQTIDADNIIPNQEALVSAKKPSLIILDDALGLSSEADVTEEIYINNAGQVLAAPYLPRLFSTLKLVEDGAFVDRQSAERAVHLLQFMVNEQTQSPEYQLLLNKLLCGITTGIPICREIAISEQEKAVIEDLIQGMIQNWKTIGNTSINGLRQTFLQRKGKLQLKEGMWYLIIEPGTFDMLLDGLPWSFSVIKHAWMDRAIHVTWR
jgi:contractile injection system tape measure protein